MTTKVDSGQFGIVGRLHGDVPRKLYEGTRGIVPSSRVRSLIDILGT